MPFLRHGSLARLLSATVHTPALRTLLGHFARLMGADAETAPPSPGDSPSPPSSASGTRTAASQHWRRRWAVCRKTRGRPAARRGRGGAGDLRRPGDCRPDGGWALPTDACVCAVDLATTARWIGTGASGGWRTAPTGPDSACSPGGWWRSPPVAIHHAYHFGRTAPPSRLHTAIPH
jgi:hypothetical protein